MRVYVCAKSLQSCPTLCNPMGWSPPGSSVHGILQARILGWVAKPSSRGSSLLRDQTCVSYVSYMAGFFTISITWETLRYTIDDFKLTRVLILHPSSSPPFCGNSTFFFHPQASNSSLELQKKSGSPESSHLLHSEGTPPALTHWAQT